MGGLIGQLTHAWPSAMYDNMPDVLNQFSRAKAKPDSMHKCKCVTWWHSVMLQSHRIKGRDTDEAFQEQCFLWKREASVGVDFDLFNFHDLLHAQEPI